MDHQQNDVLSCTMCYYTTRNNDYYIKHIVRYHKLDPNFRVRCNEAGCGATFRKWNSYLKHFRECHRDRNNLYELLNNYAGLVNNQEHNLMDDFIHADNELNPDEMNDEMDEAGQEALEMSKMERLQWSVAKFLVDVREKCKISQRAIEHVCNGSSTLFQLYSSLIMERCAEIMDPNTETIQLNDLRNIFSNEFPAHLMFETVRSKYSLDTFLETELNLLKPQEICISKEWVWKKKRTKNGPSVKQLAEISHSAYIIPFNESLKNLLQNNHIRWNVEQPVAHHDGIYRTVLDGAHYRTNNEFFRNNPNSLAVILYYDDLGITNPLGSSSSTQKMSMIYWTLANIHPEFRSSQNAIQLLAIVKTKYFKEKGALNKILKPFINDIRELETNGIEININGQNKVFKGSLLFLAGDTPASAAMGGFKESVASYRLCRTCLTNNTEWQSNFKESFFVLRNLDDHLSKLNDINEQHLTQQARAFWCTMYGINDRSPLMDIESFDITKCCPQDCMHVLIEGVLRISLKLFLKHLIINESLFTVSDLNRRIDTFDYGHLQRDKPAHISRDDLLDDNHLRQSASQLLALAHSLPFLIYEWVSDIQDQTINSHITCFILLLQLINMCLAFEIKIESVYMLRSMIERFIILFNILYPNAIVPKFHFLIHIPTYIILFGPARQQWCMRFEAVHAHFKSLVPVVRNFKNMAYTLAYRHQVKLCTNLTSSVPGILSKTFLYDGDNISVGPKLIINNLQYAELLREFINEPNLIDIEIINSPKITITGTTYSKKTPILMECEDDELPVFAEIIDIYIVRNRILAVVEKLFTLFYNNKLNAYKINQLNNPVRNIVDLKNIIFPHPLSFYTANREKYIIFLYHERCEFLM